MDYLAAFRDYRRAKKKTDGAGQDRALERIRRRYGRMRESQEAFKRIDDDREAQGLPPCPPPPDS